MKKENGLSMIALILIVVIITIVVVIGVRYIRNYIQNEKDEDIKTSMLLIQGKITEIANKHTVDEEANALVGLKLNLENNETEYNISAELKEVLTSLEDADLYILTQEDLNNMSVKDVEVNNNEFYIVDYNSEEVFYSLGINGTHRLKDLENKKEEPKEEQSENIESEEQENNVTEESM